MPTRTAISVDSSIAEEQAPLTAPLLPTSAIELNKHHKKSRAEWHWASVVALCIVAAIIYDVADYLILAPKVRLYESIVCMKHYLIHDPSLVDKDGHVPENYCKINRIQDSVATVFGWQLFFDSLSGIFLPIPYGWVADRYGRKWVLISALFGYTFSLVWILLSTMILKLPLTFVWISSAFFLIGGGSTSATTMVTTIVADVVPPEKRSSVFLYRFTCDLIAECLTPPITSLLMTKSTRLPLVLGLGFQMIGLVIALALPETLPEPISVESTESTNDENEQEQEHDEGMFDFLKPGSFFHIIFRDRAIASLLLTFFVSKVGRQSTNLLLQYVSSRYEWTLSKANLLSSLRAGMNILLYLVMLPAITAYAIRRLASPVAADLLVLRGSIVSMVLGMLALSVSITPGLMIAGLIIYTLGTGFAPIARSIVTSLVESHHATSASDIGRLYAVISVMEGIGSLVAGPGMAYAFRVGMGLGKTWLGLPFAVATGLFLWIGIVVFSVKL